MTKSVGPSWWPVTLLASLAIFPSKPRYVMPRAVLEKWGCSVLKLYMVFETAHRVVSIFKERCTRHHLSQLFSPVPPPSTLPLPRKLPLRAKSTLPCHTNSAKAKSHPLYARPRQPINIQMNLYIFIARACSGTLISVQFLFSDVGHTGRGRDTCLFSPPGPQPPRHFQHPPPTRCSPTARIDDRH